MNTMKKVIKLCFLNFLICFISSSALFLSVESRSKPSTSTEKFGILLDAGSTSSKARIYSKFSLSRSKPSTSTEKFGILLDAGGTSTKARVYSWSIDRNPMPTIRLIDDKKFKPGLGSFEDNKDGLRSYFQDILSWAKKQVPSKKQAETPIFLMATAGLRYLSSTDATLIMSLTKALLSDSSFNPFSYNPEHISILSGEEEGVYTWVAANYLNGFFDREKPLNESIGILDMGGGSMQIAFIPRGQLYSEEFQVTVAGRLYQLYAQSYLRYGSNGIKERIASKLAQGHRDQKVLENPCLLKDDSAETLLEDGTKLKQTGSGNPQECLEIIQDIVRPDTGMDCEPKPCAIGSVYQPSVDGIEFIATNGFTYAPRDLGALDKGGVLNPKRLEEAAVSFCEKPLKEAMSKNIPQKFASPTCIDGLYIATLLQESYGFPTGTQSIKATGKIGGQKIDWSMGAMLIQLSYTFHTNKERFCMKRPQK